VTSLNDTQGNQPIVRTISCVSICVEERKLQDAKKKVHFIRTDMEFVCAEFKHNCETVIAQYTDDVGLDSSD
jgi:hypothetical protein